MGEIGEVPQQADLLLKKVAQRRQDANLVPKTQIATRREQVRQESEDSEIFRSPTTRLIRGSLAATLKDIKNSPEMRVSLLPGFVAESRIMAKNLDKLDLQFNTTGKFLDAGKGPEKRNSIYAVTLDLQEKTETPDTRVPWVMIGGAYSTSEQNASLSMALALQGEKVIVLTHPEQMRDQEGFRGPKDLMRNTAREDIEMFKAALGSTGFSKVNVLGDSLGGAYALAVASDSNLSVQIENAVILQPVGFEPRSQKELMTEGNADEKRNVNDPEAKYIMAYQGNTDAKRKSGAQLHDVNFLKRAIESRKFISSSKAAGEQLNDATSVVKAVNNISGDLEIWECGEDRLARPEVITTAVEKAREGLGAEQQSRLVSYDVEGAHHNQLILNAFGFIRTRLEEQRARSEMGGDYKGAKKISVGSLERSGAEYILKQMKAK